MNAWKNWNGDPADGMGTEFKELQMLTGSGELRGHSFADGSAPAEYETLSYAGGVKKAVKKRRRKSGLLSNYQKNQKARQKQRAADSKNNAAAIAAMKESSKQSFPKLDPLPQEKKSGLSTGAIIGISLGGLALLGVIGYFALKKK